MLTDISHIYLTMPNAETIVIFGTSLALSQKQKDPIGPHVNACLCSLNPAFYDFL